VCNKGVKALAAGESSVGELRAVMMWHKDSRGAVAACIRGPKVLGRSAGSRVRQVSAGEIGPVTQRRLRDAMRKVKKDLTALGVPSMKAQFAPELTSGAQAVLLALGHCKHVSVYGMSSFNPVSYQASAGYHYQGRGRLRVTGNKVHDWAMEAGAWRLLFAAGKLALCAS